MSWSRSCFLIGLLVGTVLLLGCGRDQASVAGEHGGEHAGEEHAAPAAFKAGHGLRLAAETAAAIGVKTAEVEERRLTNVFHLTVSVFDAGPPARATSIVPREIADELERHPPLEARFLGVQRALSSALTQVELVLAMPGSPPVGSTAQVTLRGEERTVSAVSRSAVLQTATGTFVYVVNGEHLLRTSVKTGASDDRFIEIVDGLYPGDVVVSEPVEQLWLTELRLTKGGGHAH